MHVDKEEVLARFEPRELDESKKKNVETVRATFAAAAATVMAYTPASREQSLVLTKLEEASFFAVAAIARG